jgi:hypothetical protein
MTEQKTLQEASVLEIKAYLYDIGVQIENLIQQRQILTNELIERSKAETKTEASEPTEEVKAE